MLERTEQTQQQRIDTLHYFEASTQDQCWCAAPVLNFDSTLHKSSLNFWLQSETAFQPWMTAIL